MKTTITNKPYILVYDSIAKAIKSVAQDIALGTTISTINEAEVIQADSKEELITLSKSLELHSDNSKFQEFSI